MKNASFPRRNRNKEKFSALSWVIVVFLVLYCLLLITLLVWALLSSFKSYRTDFRLHPIGLPKKWTFENFINVYKEFKITIESPTGNKIISFPMLFLYGFLYSVGCSFFATLVPCLTSYMCARFDFKFSKVIYLIVVVTMILPLVGNLPAEIAMTKNFGMFDHIWGTWILKANFLGLYFIVFYNYFKNLPAAYTEAAKIDGAGNLRILFRVILPMAMPLFFTVLLINFISFWNDYQVPLIYLPSYPTIAVGMYSMSISNLTSISNIPARTAAATLMLVPILIVFLAFHKKLLGNLTMGGIKG